MRHADFKTCQCLEEGGPDTAILFRRDQLTSGVASLLRSMVMNELRSNFGGQATPVGLCVRKTRFTVCVH